MLLQYTVVIIFYLYYPEIDSYIFYIAFVSEFRFLTILPNSELYWSFFRSFQVYFANRSDKINLLTNKFKTGLYNSLYKVGL